MPATGNNIFMLEVVVYRVTLTDQIQLQNTCPICVCFQFPGLIDLVICEGGFCADGVVGGGEVRMTDGKSSLFAVNAADLCRTARDFCAIISVNRRVAGEQEMRYVAQTRLDFDRTFTDLILDPDQMQRTRKLKRVLPLYDKGRPIPVGNLEFYVCLTSQGNLLVTHFNRAPDSKKYQYQAVSEYVPTQGSAVKCCERIPYCKPSKIFRHKKSCRNKRPNDKENNDDSSYCVSEMKQANCVLTMMEKLKSLYEELKSGPTTNSNEAGEQGKPCMFDLNCLANHCPFRTGEQANAFVGHLINGTRPGNDRFPINVKQSDYRDLEIADNLNDLEIIDDADLFVVNTGRVDPCRVTAPLEYQESFTQCFDTDFSAIVLPPPTVVEKPKKGKKSKKSKKSAKLKKAK